MPVPRLRDRLGERSATRSPSGGNVGIYEPRSSRRTRAAPDDLGTPVPRGYLPESNLRAAGVDQYVPGGVRPEPASGLRPYAVSTYGQGRAEPEFASGLQPYGVAPYAPGTAGPEGQSWQWSGQSQPPQHVQPASTPVHHSYPQTLQPSLFQYQHPQPTAPPTQLEDLVNALRAPKIEMAKFSGQPLDYARFIRAFRMNVQSVCNDPGKLLVHLYNSCEGDARAAIEPYLLMAAPHGWNEAIKALQTRFGGDTLVSSKWLDKLSAAKGQTVRQMADDWRCCLTALTSLGRVSEMNHQEALRRLMSKMPSWMQSKWRGQVQRIRETGACPTFQDMVVFLERQALAQDDPVFGVRAVATEPAQASRVQQSTSRRREPVCTVAAEPDSSCPVCGAAHALAACPDFRKENHQQRWDTIRK